MELKPRFVATIVTNQAFYDFRIFLKTLRLWYSKSELPTVYVFLDSDGMNLLNEFKDKYGGPIIAKECLNPYSGLDRSQMERLQGTSGKSLFYDLTLEKLELLEWVFDVEPDASTTGVFFFDADICFLGPIPSVPASKTVALSRHHIRETDELKFGKYNAGYLWMRDRAAITEWQTACINSRFFEQAALECFDEEPWSSKLYQFPIQHNYGWWRLWQGTKSPNEILTGWSLFRSTSSAGINVDGAALCSIHTHWNTSDTATREFNRIVFEYLKKLAPSSMNASRLLKCLTSK